MDVTQLLAGFDRGKPFYPLVMQYLLQLQGIKDLSVRGLSSSITYTFPESLERENMEQVEKMLQLLDLQSAVISEHLITSVDFLAKELISEHSYLYSYTMLSASTLLILAHELCKSKSANDKGPLWEFLRHCRNASGHGGRFTFKNGEPRRPAKWRSLEISHQLEGAWLFKRDLDPGFLWPADPIILLSDIEAAYPKLAL